MQDVEENKKKIAVQKKQLKTIKKQEKQRLNWIQSRTIANARKIMSRIINEDEWSAKKMKDEREMQRKQLEKVVMDRNNLLLEGEENWYHIKKEKVNVEMIFSLLVNEGK